MVERAKSCCVVVDKIPNMDVPMGTEGDCHVLCSSGRNDS